MVNQNTNTVTLSKYEDTLLDGIPESVTEFIKVHQPKKGKSDLNNMLYIHLKQMVYNNTSYIICTPVSGYCIDVSNLSVTNSVAGLILENKSKIIGVMVIETK